MLNNIECGDGTIRMNETNAMQKIWFCLFFGAKLQSSNPDFYALRMHTRYQICKVK